MWSDVIDVINDVIFLWNYKLNCVCYSLSSGVNYLLLRVSDVLIDRCYDIRYDIICPVDNNQVELMEI